MNLTTTVALHNGVAIPQLGLGVYRSPNGVETFEMVRYTLEVGYRHVDMARIYHNEASWGLQKGAIALAKSNRAERIRQNADVFGFELSAADMAHLDTFNENLATGWAPTNEP